MKVGADSWDLMYPCSSSEFSSTGFESRYLSWNGDVEEDAGFYIDPLSSCRDDSFYDSSLLSFWDAKIDANEVFEPGFQDSEFIKDGTSISWLEDYISSFGSWGVDAIPRSYCAPDDKFNDFKITENPYRDNEQLNSYDREMEIPNGTEHSPFFVFDFGFQYGVDEDYADYGVGDIRSRHGQSWESWDEMDLYEKIFGNLSRNNDSWCHKFDQNALPHIPMFQ